MINIHVAYNIRNTSVGDKGPNGFRTGTADIGFFDFTVRKDWVIVPTGTHVASYPEPSFYPSDDRSLTMADRVIKTLDPNETGLFGFVGHYDHVLDWDAYRLPEVQWELDIGSTVPASVAVIDEICFICMGGRQIYVGKIAEVTLGDLMEKAIIAAGGMVTLDISALVTDQISPLIKTLRSEDVALTAYGISTEEMLLESGEWYTDYNLLLECESTGWRFKFELRPSIQDLSPAVLGGLILNGLSYRTVAGRCEIPEAILKKIQALEIKSID